jgi:hypothetical protein
MKPLKSIHVIILITSLYPGTGWRWLIRFLWSFGTMIKLLTGRSMKMFLIQSLHQFKYLMLAIGHWIILHSLHILSGRCRR